MKIDFKKEVTFPKGKIVLMDGTTLDGYPMATVQDAIDNTIQLDTTGQYLTVGNKKPTPIPQEPCEQRDLFIDNAFYLMAHRERIMSDSRMFLSPVTMNNGIAYTGTSGFRRPTLGVYLEWWTLTTEAMSIDSEGHRRLVYHIAGSPLTGMNHCTAVCDDGKRRRVSLSSFGRHWGPFTCINKRYDEAKVQYQAYSLEQVIAILKAEDSGTADLDHALEVEFLKHETTRMEHEMEEFKRMYEQETKNCNVWRNRYYRMLLATKDAEVMKIVADYREMKQSLEDKKAQLIERKLELKAALRRGEIDNKTFQKQVTPPMNKLKKDEFELPILINDCLADLFPNERVDIHTALDYVKNKAADSSKNI